MRHSRVSLDVQQEDIIYLPEEVDSHNHLNPLPNKDTGISRVHQYRDRVQVLSHQGDMPTLHDRSILLVRMGLIGVHLVFHLVSNMLLGQTLVFLLLPLRCSSLKLSHIHRIHIDNMPVILIPIRPW
jgi:hypothetical protein